ncbi:NUDIX hydrolase [Ruegeria marina]|uniref:8-oxo-dGTP pyrophosphatase MutT, NUDIX family n=1 Tax=Ruegeria marina TaxID=639004 RepID=A0A1G6RVM7_9RHOB|nr:NUDIX hydrolase [Ruegeria marina]SDD08730.1 8-oxo-dGTP pyrophosphatase MutT, NUDIX family [Ruegeria marina]
MRTKVSRAWAELVSPILRRPKRAQVAALCLRPVAQGQEVLLITSLDTGRWIVPKGWPIEGMSGAETALHEAWEEAGVSRAEVTDEPVGVFGYGKRRKNGTVEPVETYVYRVDVAEQSDEFPEAGQRTLRWVAPLEAANMVQEPQLQELLRQL